MKSQQSFFKSLAKPKFTDFQRFFLKLETNESEKLMRRIGNPDGHYEYTFVSAKMSPYRRCTLKYVVYRLTSLYFPIFVKAMTSECITNRKLAILPWGGVGLISFPLM